MWGAVVWGAAGVDGEGVNAVGVPLRRMLVLLSHAATAVGAPLPPVLLCRAAARASLREDHRGGVAV